MFFTSYFYHRRTHNLSKTKFKFFTSSTIPYFSALISYPTHPTMNSDNDYQHYEKSGRHEARELSRLGIERRLKVRSDPSYGGSHGYETWHRVTGA